MHQQRTIRAALSLGLRRFLLPIGAAFSLVVLVAIGAVAGLGLTADRVAATVVDDEHAFVQQINDLRTAKGLNALTVDAELTIEARSWASAMAASDSLSHNPDMTKGISAQWTVLGENVGVHSVHNLPELFQAFIDSPDHYRNLVDERFQYVGVGVVYGDNGKLWTTHRFMAAEARAAAPPTTIPVAQPPTTAPPQTASPNTSPPATSPPQTSPPQTKAPQADPSKTGTTKPTQPPTTAAPTTRPSWSPTTTAGKSDPTDKPQTTQSTRSPNTAPLSEPTDGGSTEPWADDSDSAHGGTPDDDRFEAQRSEIAERVRPDPETVENVLNDLVLAGI